VPTVFDGYSVANHLPARDAGCLGVVARWGRYLFIVRHVDFRTCLKPVALSACGAMDSISSAASM
jgi:hypothetical protein